jgi:hypothetical protein
MEPVRNFLRHKKASVKFYEAEATKIDYEKKIVYINDDSEIKGEVSSTEVAFDMLVVGVGAENATFGKFSHMSFDLERVRRGFRLLQFDGLELFYAIMLTINHQASPVSARTACS